MCWHHRICWNITQGFVYILYSSASASWNAKEARKYRHGPHFLKYFMLKLLVSGSPHILFRPMATNKKVSSQKTKGCVDLWDTECFSKATGKWSSGEQATLIRLWTKESSSVPQSCSWWSKEVTRTCLMVISHLKIAFYLSCETPDCFIVFAAVLFCLVFVAKGGVEEKDEQF